MAQNNLANAVADALLALLGLVVVVVGEVERVGGLVSGQGGVAYAKVLEKGEKKKEIAQRQLKKQHAKNTIVFDTR